MAFVLLSRFSSKTRASVKPVVKQKSACGQHLGSRFQFSKPVMETRPTAVTSAPVNQTRLELGKANDKREAKRVAEQVTPMPGLATTETTTLDSMSTGDQSLPESVRAFFEPRFGTDLGGVRVHADTEAGKLSRALGAEAFTIGADIYFGPGAYRPASATGRRLLAHELTHVMQQSGTTPACIQRRLLVTADKKADIKALFDLLEPASGFTLKHDPKTKEVSIVAARLKPASFVLATRLAEIIDDPNRDAELNLGRNQPGVSFGKFPESGPLIQEINIAGLESLEAKAPGSGVAFITHEIVENYHAHTPALQQFSRTGPGGILSQSHEEALMAESLVAGELVGPGARVARAVADMGKNVVWFVDDYEQYFLVIERNLKTGVMTNAWQVPRVNMGIFTISGFAIGSPNVPAAAQPTVAAVADAMSKNPSATVRMEVGGRDRELALRRADAVESAILDDGKNRGLSRFDLRSGNNFNVIVSGLEGQIVITVDQPDTAVQSSRGSLVKRWLTSTGRRT